MEQSVRSNWRHNIAVAWVEAHHGAGLLVRAVLTLTLAVAPLLHTDTGAVLTGELVVVACCHRHVPAVLRATAVIVDLPGLSTQQERACRGRAHSIKIMVLGASRFPL